MMRDSEMALIRVLAEIGATLKEIEEDIKKVEKAIKKIDNG